MQRYTANIPNRSNPFSSSAVAFAMAAVLMFAGCASSRSSQRDVTEENVTYRGAPKNVKQFDVDGIQVIMRPSGPANHVIAAELFIRGGLPALPKDVSPAVQSLALEVPPLSGPSTMTKQEYRRLIDRMVTGILPSDTRDYSSMTLRSVDENFDRSWDLFAGVVMHPQFDSLELRNAKERLTSAIQNRTSDPESYAEFLADSAYFYGHPYGRTATVSDVQRVTEADLLAQYHRMFVKSRLLLVVVGNVDSADLYHKVATSLATLPEGDYKQTPLPEPQNANRPEVIIRPAAGDRDAVPTTYIVARHRVPQRTDSLYYAMLRLSSFVSGSLFREIRMERNLSYAPDAEVNFTRTPYGEITMSTTLPDSAWRTAKREVIDFFRDYIIADEYITSGLGTWITSTYLKEQTNASQAHELGLAQIYTGSWTNEFRLIDGLRSLTAEQINEAAQLYLRNFTVAIVGDTSAVTRSEFLPDDSTRESESDRYESKGEYK